MPMEDNQQDNQQGSARKLLPLTPETPKNTSLPTLSPCKRILAVEILLVLLAQPFVIWSANKKRQANAALSVSNGDDLREWEVVFPEGVSVRDFSNVESPTLRKYPRGSILIGKQIGEWMELFNESGYVKISFQPPNSSYNVTSLRPRTTSYVAHSHGTCLEIGMFPITDKTVCMIAALKSGINANIAEMSERMTCSYIFEISSQTSNNLHSGLGSLCSSQDYPTTRSNMTTPLPPNSMHLAI